ncbi:TrmB family transcriptional regulator [Methanocella sp. MCL-LM]|uniref:TrmB family transcriptional regulator n=1 Tax=Methanocella sp. MCL-LM TaxID=3412035 RepID=UPI003C71E9F8
MSQTPHELIESLKTLGLTEYEAKVYATLVALDRAEVKPICENVDIPRPSVYQSLKTLTDKGLVQVVNAKPAVYRATPPEIAIEHIAEAHKSAEKNALQMLSELEGSISGGADEEALWTLYGTENIEHSMEELLKGADKSVKLVLPADHYHYLDLLRGKKVEVELIVFGSSIEQIIRSGIKSLKVHNALGLDAAYFASIAGYLSRLPVTPEQLEKFILLIVDDEEVMYAPPFPARTKSGIRSKNPMFVALAGIVFTAVWEHTPQVAPRTKQ